MDTVRHTGRVVSITPQFTTVEIVSESACASCHAAALCGMGDSATKAIEVPTRAWDTWQVGDEVDVLLKASMGHKAVWLGYVIPLAVLMAALFALMALGAGELAAGLGALGAVALYYFVIWLFRERLRNEYVFTIENKS